MDLLPITHVHQTQQWHKQGSLPAFQTSSPFSAGHRSSPILRRCSLVKALLGFTCDILSLSQGHGSHEHHFPLGISCIWDSCTIFWKCVFFNPFIFENTSNLGYVFSSHNCSPAAASRCWLLSWSCTSAPSLGTLRTLRMLSLPHQPRWGNNVIPPSPARRMTSKMSCRENIPLLVKLNFFQSNTSLPWNGIPANSSHHALLARCPLPGQGMGACHHPLGSHIPLPSILPVPSHADALQACGVVVWNMEHEGTLESESMGFQSSFLLLLASQF